MKFKLKLEQIQNQKKNKNKLKIYKINYIVSILKRQTILQAIDEILDDRKNFEFNILAKVLNKNQQKEELQFEQYKQKWMNKNILTDNMEEKVKVMNEILQDNKQQKLQVIRQRIEENKKQLDEIKNDMQKRQEKIKDIQSTDNVIFNNFKPAKIGEQIQEDINEKDDKEILNKAKQNIKIIPKILKELESQNKMKQQERYNRILNEKTIIQQLDKDSVKIARRVYQYVETKQQRLQQLKYYQENLQDKKQHILKKKDDQEKKVVIKQINTQLIDNLVIQKTQSLVNEIVYNIFNAKQDTHSIIHKALNDKNESKITKKEYLDYQQLLNKQLEDQQVNSIMQKFEETIYIKQENKKDQNQQNFFREFDMYYDKKQQEITEEKNCEIF